MMAATKALAGDEILQRVPLKRFVTSEDVAGLAVFLLSDRGRAITAGTYTIDGGFVAG